LALAAITYPNRTKAEWADFDNFFHANIDLIDIGKHPNLHDYANRQTDQVSYYLASWSEHDAVKGYAYLGYSSWEEYGPYAGIPDKAGALAYARSIGANLVVYSTMDTIRRDDYGWLRISHWITFYAGPLAGGGSYVDGDIARAERELQAAWERLSYAKKHALKPSQLAWIKVKDAAGYSQKLAMIKERTAFLSQQ
jgi:hypothetical protein